MRTDRKTWRLLQGAIDTDIVVGFRVLRRTFNTLLIETGTDRIIQRSIVGHTSEEMTERYGGVRMETKKDALEKVIALAAAKEESN